ncbi:MAG: TolC family protein, partial [Lysobacter sp.]
QAQRVRLELEGELRRAVDSYRAAQSAWSRWQASRGTDVERRANLLERLWREGELSTADYLLQLKQTLDTQLVGAELEARLWRFYADYLAATGQLERWAGLEGTP